MGKGKVLQGSFSSGTLSPQAIGRVDIARYPNAAKVLRNVVSRTLGGAKKRYGTQYIAATKNSAKRSRLVPFIVSADVAYMLELGDVYLRVFKPDGTQVAGPYELVTPYTGEESLAIDFSQSENGMFVFHGNRYPRVLASFADNNWAIKNAAFTALPFAEIGDYYTVALTLSSNTVGAGRTMTGAAAVFLASDVGRAIIWNAGIAVITGFTSTTIVTVTVNNIFDSTAIPSGLWNLDSSPQTSLTPSAKDPVGATITLTLPAGGEGWRATDVGKYVRANGGLVKITAYTSALVVSAVIIDALTSTVAVPALAWTLEGAVWSTANYPRTGTFHEQRLVAAGTTKNPQTVWGSRTGEPLDFTIGTQDDDAFSFTLSGDDNQVNRINFLVSAGRLLALTYGGEFSLRGGVEKPITPTNIQVTTEPPHGCGTVRPVQAGQETLFVQRSGRKLRAMGYSFQTDGYNSPDLTTLSEHITASGIAAMAFQQEPDPVVWLALNNGRLISVTLDRDLEVTAWNDHETDGAVESIAVMPSGGTEQVWLIVRRNVNLRSVTFDTATDLFSAVGHGYVAGDEILLTAATINAGFTVGKPYYVIAAGLTADAYALSATLGGAAVNGTTNGAGIVSSKIVRYVERMQSNWYPVYGTASPEPNIFPPGDEPFDWGFTLDCAITADDAAGKAIWDVAHLKGKTVRCLADGVDMPPMVVDSTTGQITLPRNAKRVLIGLMFKPTVTLLTPEIQTGTGSAQADAMSTNELVLRFYNTIGATVNGDQTLPGRTNGPGQLDFAPELFTGDKPNSMLGWAKGKSEITISQDDPFPFHLLAAIRSLTVNGG